MATSHFLSVLVMWRLWHIFSEKTKSPVRPYFSSSSCENSQQKKHWPRPQNGFHGSLNNTPEPVSYRPGEDDEEETGEDADASSLVHTLRWHVAVLSSSLRPRRVSSIWRFEVSSAFDEDLWKLDPYDRPSFFFLRGSSPRGSNLNVSLK